MKQFDYAEGIRPKKNKFDLSYENKLTLNMGDLVPILCEEVLPTDSWRVNSQIFLRMLALIAPVMHRVDVWTHYFFVPNRLIWDEWESFITGGEQGTSEPIPPYFDFNDLPAGAGKTALIGFSSLTDYLGLPMMPSVATGATKFEVSALPYRAYNLIYDQYYRDQNYIGSDLFDGWKASGNTYDLTQLQKFLGLRKRAWEHDYFTSILPDTQRGAEVTVPIGQTGSMKLRDIVVTDSTGDPVTVNSKLGTNDAVTPDGELGYINDSETWAKAGLDANVEDVELEGVSVNSLRQSITLQGFLEAMMRFGSRYVEYLRGIFAANPRDARLQRAEYLGGGVQQIAISEVLQTGQPTSESSLPQGNMAGHGLSFGRTNGFSRTFDEHGYVIGIMSVLPKTSYNRAIKKGWFRATRYDYYQPHLAHLGEQEVLQVELQPVNGAVGGYTPFSDPAPEVPGLNYNVLGFQSRFAEYKYNSGQIHGQFLDTLSFWHLSRMFDGGSPTPINQSFIESDPRKDIFAVETDDDHLVAQIFHEISVLRPIPLFSTPSLLFPSHA